MQNNLSDALKKYDSFHVDIQSQARQLIKHSSHSKRLLILFKEMLAQTNQEEISITIQDISKYIVVDRYSLYSLLNKMDMLRIIKYVGTRPKKVLFRVQHAEQMGFNPINSHLVEVAGQDE